MGIAKSCQAGFTSIDVDAHLSSDGIPYFECVVVRSTDNPAARELQTRHLHKRRENH